MTPATTTRTSVAMTADTHDALARHLLRGDGQEDICLALYRRSTGATRGTAIVQEVVLPEPGERAVHGNASITGGYVLRAAALAQQAGCGLVLAHSHPGGHGWQGMSLPDRDAETSYANLAREITGQPLVGMTLAGDGAWSARHWDRGAGPGVEETAAESLRVLGDRLNVSWNDQLLPPPTARHSQVGAVASWGPRTHADLTRRSALVVRGRLNRPRRRRPPRRHRHHPHRHHGFRHRRGAQPRPAHRCDGPRRPFAPVQGGARGSASRARMRPPPSYR